MRVTVIGATGGTGRAAVDQLLRAGHDVHVLVRRPEALALTHPRLRVVLGDALDAPKVKEAITGSEAVIVALGVRQNPFALRFGAKPNTPWDVCTRGTRIAIDAMKSLGIRRLITVSAYGVGDSYAATPGYVRLFIKAILSRQYADKEGQERAVRESGLDWVILRPVGLSDEPARGNILASATNEARGTMIPRGDVAAFAISCLQGGEWIGRTASLSVRV